MAVSAQDLLDRWICSYLVSIATRQNALKATPVTEECSLNAAKTPKWVLYRGTNKYIVFLFQKKSSLLGPIPVLTQPKQQVSSKITSNRYSDLLVMIWSVKRIRNASKWARISPSVAEAKNDLLMIFRFLLEHFMSESMVRMKNEFRKNSDSSIFRIADLCSNLFKV